MDLIALDRQLFLFLNNLGETQFDQLWLLISKTFVWIPFYVILLYFLYKNLGIRTFLFSLIFIALGVTISDQLANIFKEGIGRLRPCHDAELVPLMRTVTCGGKFGFFSSHASNTFFVASFMTFMLSSKNAVLPYVLFIWAGFVSYSRVYLGVHFPLDVLMGAATGFLLGGLFANLTTKVHRRQSL